ncbi:hypothetical protein HMPREF9946_02161 [Acetobacteraceae bacterium AT-5844]|nr:hypothetical protein HMPREF9946_02161 [Acetobacteraceae bacterium AT-5844]
MEGRMAATTNYQAGVESNLVRLGYVQETAWGVAPSPAGKLKALRFTSESLRGQKTRQRPTEINTTRSASAAITTEETASGNIDFALSYGTYDDLLAGLLKADWSSDALVNSDVFKSFLIEKRLSANTLLQYPGSQVTGATLNIQRGQFLSGNFSFLSKEEVPVTVSASTGGTYDAAPTGRVMDPVGGVRDVMWDDAPMGAVCNLITLNITNDGAGADYGLGSSAAQGMRMGTFLVSGAAEFYFRSFEMYQRYKDEIAGKFSVRTLDAAGNAYKFILPVATLMNPTINAGGQNQPVMARYELEGNPDENGVHLRIERTPAATGP